MKILIKEKPGFTLIELMLYMSLLSIMLLAISFFLTSILQARIKNQTIAEVEQQGVQVLQLMGQAIRNSASINSPTTGQNGTSVSLVMSDTAKNPTIFTNTSNAINIQEGSGSAIPLTSGKITATGLNFQNLSRTGTFGTVKYSFTLTFNNTSGRNEYNYSKTFYGSASLRY